MTSAANAPTREVTMRRFHGSVVIILLTFGLTASALGIAAPGLSAQDLSTRPQRTPYTVAPGILNRDDVVRAMAQEYPPLLRDAGIGGTVRIYFFIEAGGTVGHILVDQSSGNEALDQAALNVAAVYRFSPARNGDTPVPVWVSFPITFQVR